MMTLFTVNIKDGLASGLSKQYWYR